MAANRIVRFMKLMVDSRDVGEHLTTATSHQEDDTLHHVINDSGAAVDELWSSSKLLSDRVTADANIAEALLGKLRLRSADTITNYLADILGDGISIDGLGKLIADLSYLSDVYYLQTAFVNASTGAAHAGLPVVLDSTGQLDVSFIPSGGLVFVDEFTPTGGAEYPTNPTIGEFWRVEGVDAGSGYTFTTGDLTGETVLNGDSMTYGSSGWSIASTGLDPNLVLLSNGSVVMEADFGMNQHKMVDLAEGTDDNDAVTIKQSNISLRCVPITNLSAHTSNRASIAVDKAINTDGKIAVIGVASPGVSVGIDRSHDAITWHSDGFPSAIPERYTLIDWNSGEGLFVAIPNDLNADTNISNGMYVSTDGDNWAQEWTKTGLPTSIEDIIWKAVVSSAYGSLYPHMLLVGHNPSDKGISLYFGADLATDWYGSNLYAANAVDIYGVAVTDSSVYCALIDVDLVGLVSLYTDDMGVNWTQVILSAAGSSVGDIVLAKSLNKFLVVVTLLSGYTVIYSSYDGANWVTEFTTSDMYTFVSMTWSDRMRTLYIAMVLNDSSHEENGKVFMLAFDPVSGFSRIVRGANLDETTISNLMFCSERDGRLCMTRTNSATGGFVSAGV